MRLVKFRVWDVKNKTMDYAPESDILIWEGQKFNLAFEEDERFILTQFTGRKDSNGVDIYENDILGYGDKYPCVVEWDDLDCGFVAREYDYEEKRYRTHSMADLNWVRLGTIYDSPELIKK